MTNQIPIWKTVLIRFTDEKQSDPLEPLKFLPKLGAVADQREELERWFAEAISAAGDHYEYFEHRQKAFLLRDTLLDIIEAAHFLQRLNNEQKKELLLSVL